MREHLQTMEVSLLYLHIIFGTDYNLMVLQVEGMGAKTGHSATKVLDNYPTAEANCYCSDCGLYVCD